MLVTVECVKTGRGSKGVCVNVYEATAESPHPAIAVQILQPGNIWGVENPPPDWVTVLANLGAAPPSSPTDSSWSGVASKASPAPRVKPMPSGRETAAPATGAASAARLSEEAEQIARNALASFEQRLAARLEAAEGKLLQQAEQAATELAASVQALKGSVVSQIIEGAREELAVRLEAMVRSHEERFLERAAKAESEFAARAAAKSAEEVQTTETALEAWMGGAMRQHEARFAELTEQAVAEMAAATQELRISAALELAESAKETLQPDLEKLATEYQGRLFQRAGQLESEMAARMTAQASEAARAAESAFDLQHAEALRKAESELTARVNETLRHFEGALNTFRAHFADDLAAQNEKAIQEAEQAVRARLAAMLSTLVAPPASPANK
jgi:hypothetical protein